MCRSVSIFHTYAIENFELNLGALSNDLRTDKRSTNIKLKDF